MICAISFVDGFSDSRSSRNPKAAIATPQPSSCHDPRSRADDEPGADDGGDNRHAAEQRRRALCQRSSFGRAMNPKRCASALQTGVSASDDAAEIRNQVASALIFEGPAILVRPANRPQRIRRQSAELSH